MTNPIASKPPSIYPWQNSQWQHFNAIRAADHLPHALLLAGSDGSGKNDFASILANSLLCEQITADGYACEQCKGCKVKCSGAHPDYKHVGLPEGKQQIPVHAIRELSNFLTLSRSYAGYRVVLISSADKMNINAANSLLKSLEEPPSHTVIILVANQLSRLPVTILSRCQVMSFSKPDRKTALNWLNTHNLEHPAEMLLSLGEGKPLPALAFDNNDANQVLIADRKKFANDILSVLQHRTRITVIAKDWQKADLNALLNWQLKWLHATLKMHAVATDNLTAGNKFLAQIQASVSSYELLWKLYTDLLHLKSMTSYPLNRILFIESMLLLWRDAGRYPSPP